MSALFTSLFHFTAFLLKQHGVTFLNTSCSYRSEFLKKSKRKSWKTPNRLVQFISTYRVGVLKTTAEFFKNVWHCLYFKVLNKSSLYCYAGILWKDLISFGKFKFPYILERETIYSTSPPSDEAIKFKDTKANFQCHFDCQNQCFDSL